MKRQWRAILIGMLLWLGLGVAAHAAVTVTFYSRDYSAQSFPHAFFTVKGTPDGGGPPVDTNYGFTAAAISPAILFGPVRGEIVAVTPGYLAKSDSHMSFMLNDAEYERLMTVVQQWRDTPGRSYSLSSHNCVHFARGGGARGWPRCARPARADAQAAFLPAVRDRAKPATSSPCAARERPLARRSPRRWRR